MTLESVILTQAELQELTGGYTRPAWQLKELKARGFTRARRSNITGQVILERAHYDAVVRGTAGGGADDMRPQVRPPSRLKRVK